MRLSLRTYAAIGLVGTLWACGSDGPSEVVCPPVPPVVGTPQPTPTPKPTKSPSTKPTKQPSAKPTAKPSAKPSSKPSAKPSAKPGTADPADPGQGPDAMALLQEVKAKTLGSSGMQGEITSYDMKLDGTEQNVGTYKIWLKDRSYRLENIAHTKKNNVGSKVVLTYGEDSARVKPAGFLSVVTVTLKLTDPNLLSPNGVTLDKILSHGVLERVTNGSYNGEVIGTTKVGGDTVTVVKVTPKSGSHPLVAQARHEYVGFDDNKVYRLWSLYGGPELGLPQDNLLAQITVNKATLGVSIPADMFKL